MNLTTLQGRTVLVTGAGGFLGTYLTHRLRRVGAIVRGADRTASSGSMAFDLAERATYGPILEGQEVVYHLAAWIGRPGDDPTLAERLNVEAVRDLVIAAARAGVSRFVLVSSVAVYGLPELDRVTEDTPLQVEQADAYGRTKAMGEQAAWEAAGASEMELVVVRPGQIHGPGARNWTRKLAELVRDGTPSVIGAGDGLLFPVFVENLLDALLLAGSVPEAAGLAFHICDGPVSWRDWMAAYGRMAGRAPRTAPLWAAKGIAWVAERLPLGVALNRQHVRFSQRKLIFDTTRAETVLGWCPRVPLDEAMERSEVWLHEEGVL